MTTETPILNDHKQSCGSASAEDKRAYIMPSDSKFTAGKQEYPPMHSGEFDISQIRLDKMKGKNVFTQKEINELKRLITLRVNSTNKSKKKKLRDNMRKIG